jgi:hypothetical protein
MAKLQPAETSLWFTDTVGNLNGKYVDIPQVLSFVNRRLYDQGKVYFVEQIKLWYTPSAAEDRVIMGFGTIHDTWVTRNAYTKARALWNEMNDKVLDDNESVQGKWHDFKVFMDLDHQQGGSNDSGPLLNLMPEDFNNAEIAKGEWVISSFVLPQHEVDPATGLPLAADQYTSHMLGDDDGTVATGLDSGGIIKMYSDTRARVVAAPDVPADMIDSWGTLLTDDGSQEPELATIISGANDLPPYDRTDFVGGDTNWNYPSVSGVSVMSTYSPDDVLSGFGVPLGLIRISALGQGSETTNNSFVGIQMIISKGMDKGVATLPMRQ